MDTEGKTWPLQLVFLLTMIGGAAGLVEPKLFGTGFPPDRTIPWVLFGVAVVSASILYIPYIPFFREVLRDREAIGVPANPAAGTLLARIGTPANPAAGTLLALMSNLETLAGAVGAPNDPQPGTLLARIGSTDYPGDGTLLARIRTLETLMAALGSPKNPQPGTLLARIGSVSNPEEGTLLARMSTLERLCRSCEDRLL
jgi:hypothetical protein